MNNNDKVLLLIDGHAVLHRAWHALPPLTNKSGMVVSGAYGFMMTMLSAIKKFRPTHLAVAFDLAGPTFRHEQYREYKAGREKKPDELYQQVPILMDILEKMGVPVITAEGYEADDAIGTAAVMATKKGRGLKTVIVTGDLDTLQLVNDKVRVFTMRRGITDTVIYDPAKVEDRYGLTPDQMVDYKALRGDPSDNIPGVKGVGEKTATELLQRFGTVANLYKAVDKGGKSIEGLKESLLKKLEDGRDNAMQALDLCLIRKDAPIDFDLKKAVYKLPPKSEIIPLFEELQFNRLLQQWPSEEASADGSGDKKKSAGNASKPKKSAPSPQASLAFGEPEPAEYELVDSKKGLVAALKEVAKEKKVAFRSLLTDDHPAFPTVDSLGLRLKSKTVLIPSEMASKHAKLLGALFADSKTIKYCHDLKREISALSQFGLDIGQDGYGPFEDLMLASYLILAGERKSDLDSLLSFNRNLPPAPKKQEGAEARNRLSAELEHLTGLTDEYLGSVKQFRMEKLYRDVELPLASTLSRMERLGVLIDKKYFADLGAELEKRLAELTKRIHKLAGEEFNINSPKQVQEMLFDRLGLNPKGLKRAGKTGTVSTAASELEKLIDDHPIIPEILSYREAAKIQSTYVEALPQLIHPKTGRIHARFNQAVTATGRLSSSDPNLQNIPTKDNAWAKRVRQGFIAPKGRLLLAADYSQIELRIAAHLAGEKTMLEAFRNGEDIHWRTAVTMFGKKEAADKRRVAKAINFGILYGMGQARLAASTGLSSAEAREYIDHYFALHPGLATYIEEMKAKVAQDGYVETLFGRRRFFHNFRLMNRREQAEAERQAVNTPMQGTQADMIKMAMNRLDRVLAENFGERVKMIIQVHDELIFEVEKGLEGGAAKIITEEMKGVAKLDVPIEVDAKVGPDWGNMKKMQ